MSWGVKVKVTIEYKWSNFSTNSRTWLPQRQQMKQFLNMTKCVLQGHYLVVEGWLPYINISSDTCASLSTTPSIYSLSVTLPSKGISNPRIRISLVNQMLMSDIRIYYSRLRNFVWILEIISLLRE